jgi:3',5'-cyclic AMP phosphodiesterase CpdA
VSGRTSITILHISDTQFGAKHRFGNEGLTAGDRRLSRLVSRLLEDIALLRRTHGLEPDLIVASGDLAETGSRSEFQQVRDFLAELAAGLGLDRNRVVMVPGNHDINWRKCEAYFLNCEADETEPVPPYWPKLEHYAAMFAEFYSGVRGVSFPKDQPWTLFEMPELKTVVAGLNSTIAESHRPEDHYGYCGDEQLYWFADRLSARAADGWLRIAALHHNPVILDRNDSAFLRDHDRLAELVAPHLNLILHGHTHAGKLCSFSPDGVPVLCAGSAGVRQDARPDDVPNQYQLVQVTAGGVRVYARRYNPERRRWEGDTSVGRRPDEWIRDINKPLENVHAVFGGGEEHDEDPLRKVAYDREVVHRRPDDLLAKVRRVCEIRYGQECVDEVEIRVDRPIRYLRITQPGPPVSQYPVGVHEGEISQDVIDGFTRHVHDRYRAGDPGLRSFLVYEGEPAPDELKVQANLRGIVLQPLIEFQGLYDLRPYARRQAEELAKSDIYPSELYVPQRFRLISPRRPGAAETPGKDLLTQIQEWVADYDGRFIVVLGDFGHGKTFLLRELARRIHEEERPPVIPVFIQLRHLEKAHSFEEILAAHFAKSGEEEIRFPLLRNLISEGRVLLLFDGFDELALRITYAKAAQHLSSLVGAAKGRAKVVLTSRTQYFLSDHEVETALASQLSDMPGRRLVKIQEFGDDQILEFLTRLYKGDDTRARATFELLGDVRDLLGLSRNPRMLSFIARLDENRLRRIRDREGEISAAVLYRELLEWWLGYEYERAQPDGAPPALTEKERWEAVTKLALLLWETGEETLGLAELGDVSAKALRNLADRQITPDQAAHMIGSGTLLVRVEYERFKFVHQSILEWLVANHVAERFRAGDNDPAQLKSAAVSDLMTDFLATLAGPQTVEHWARRTLWSDPGSTTETAKRNALFMLRRLGLPLQPGDSKGDVPRPLQLTGVNLRHADLAAADLRRAILRKADLRDARLDGADLSGADLREADLSGARLIGADLRGAVTRGSRWRCASLVGAETNAEFRQVDTFGAALPGHITPVLQTSPPAKVSYMTSAWHPKGTHLATGSADGTARIWDAATGTPLHTLTGHTSWVRSVAWHPDGTRLATAGDDRTVRIWDATTGTPLHTLTGHSDIVRSVAWHPDGTRLATAGDDRTARILDATTGTPLHTLTGHTSWVHSVAWHPNGTHLATASADGAIGIWDTRDYTCLGRILPLPQGAAVFSADGLTYKFEGDPAGRFWWAINLCVFAPGELDPYIPELRRVPFDTPLSEMSRARQED